MDIETYFVLRCALPRHIVELIGNFLREISIHMILSRSGNMGKIGRTLSRADILWRHDIGHAIVQDFLFDVNPPTHEQEFILMNHFAPVRPLSMDGMLTPSGMHITTRKQKTKATAADFGMPTRRQQTRRWRNMLQRK